MWIFEDEFAKEKEGFASKRACVSIDVIKCKSYVLIAFLFFDASWKERNKEKVK